MSETPPNHFDISRDLPSLSVTAQPSESIYFCYCSVLFLFSVSWMWLSLPGNDGKPVLTLHLYCVFKRLTKGQGSWYNLVTKAQLVTILVGWYILQIKSLYQIYSCQCIVYSV